MTAHRAAAAFMAPLLLVLSTACQTPSVPSLIKGEPVCKDVKQAGEMLKGGLKQPVRLRVMLDKEVTATIMIYGLPESSPQPTRFLLPDANQTYTLEWGQCKGERALTTYDPRDKAAAQKSGQGGTFTCTEVDVYAETKHTTKKGDAASHEIALETPPNAACW